MNLLYHLSERKLFMKKTLWTLVAAFILSFIPGCQVCSVENTSIFGNWAIEDIPSATAKKIKPAPKANIVIQSARVHGCAGDNRFFGSMKIEDNKLIFSHMGMTRMMGPNARYEGFFMEALNQVTQFAVIKGKMCLLDKNGKTMIVLKPGKAKEEK